MTFDLDPIVGNWYWQAELNRYLEVVAVDDLEGYVELQDATGDFERLLLEDWYEADLEPTSPPESIYAASLPLDDDSEFTESGDFDADLG